MRLKEVDLMLKVGVGSIGILAAHGEMVKEPARSQVGPGLGDQLRPPHVGVPESSRVNGNLDAVGVGIRWVLVGLANRDIAAGGTGAVNVVLVGTDLVTPRPLIKEGSIRVLVQTTIYSFLSDNGPPNNVLGHLTPKDSASTGNRSEDGRESNKELHFDELNGNTLQAVRTVYEEIGMGRRE